MLSNDEQEDHDAQEEIEDEGGRVREGVKIVDVSSEVREALDSSRNLAKKGMVFLRGGACSE